MYYGRMNDNGKSIALEIAKAQGLEGRVGVEHTPWGEVCAFFHLKKKAIGEKAVGEASTKLRTCGFDPDVLFMGTPVELHGGFIGEDFTKRAKAHVAAKQEHAL